MEYSKIIGKHELKIICNKEEILQQIENERSIFEKNYFQRYYTVGYEDGYLAKEEYEENLQYIINELERITQDNQLEKYIDSAQKKKNGTFYKNRIIEKIGCDNTVFITDWHNTWIYNALKVQAYNDNILRIVYSKETDTPA